MGTFAQIWDLFAPKMLQNQNFKNRLYNFLDNPPRLIWSKNEDLRIILSWVFSFYVILKKSHFSENYLILPKITKKTWIFFKITSTYYLKWPEFDKTNRKAHIWWILVHLSQNCRKYLAFLANFVYFFQRENV